MSLDPLTKGINDGNPREEAASQEFPPPSEFLEEDNTGSVLENSTIAMDGGNISELEQSEETQYSNNSNNLNNLEKNTYKTNLNKNLNIDNLKQISLR